MPQEFERTVFILRVDREPLLEKEEGNLFKVPRLCHGAENMKEVTITVSKTCQRHANTPSTLQKFAETG